MRKVFNISSRTAALAFCLLVPFLSQAEPATESVFSGLASVNWLTMFVLGVLAFVILVLAFLMYALTVFKNYIHPEAAKASSFAGLFRKLTDSVPVEHEAAILTDHEYDGIQELDNNLPPWWKYMFYATILFSGIYIYYYHFSSGKLQIQEYEEQIALGEKQKQSAANSVDENTVKLISDAAVLERGKTIFTQNCAACHGVAGEGKVGPNLTDEYWLHGGGVKNVFKTIKYGVPQKGMMAWNTQLSPVNIQEVANYIMSLQGTNPPNAKPAEGNKEESKELASK